MMCDAIPPGVAVQVRRAVPEDAAPTVAVHVRAWQVAYRGLMPDQVLDGLSVAQRERTLRQALTGEESPPVDGAVEDGGTGGVLRRRGAQP